MLARKNLIQSQFGKEVAVSLLKFFNLEQFFHNFFIDGCENKNCPYYSVCQRGKCVCPQHCDSFPDPVCGSDLVTYPNECSLKLKACQSQKFIIPIRRGACTTCKDIQCEYGARCEDGVCVCPRKCPNHYDPVCGSNNITYDNDCKIMAASCESTSKITTKHRGECERMFHSPYSDPSYDVPTSSQTDSKRIVQNHSTSPQRVCDYNICKYSGICVLDDKDEPKCLCK